MGMDQRVAFGADRAPTWVALRTLLAERGLPLQLRMIDGELAFPDEEPAEAWQELRVGAEGGMVTLRRESGGIRVVTWGNADAATQRAWNALAWALAVLSAGTIETASGPLTADAFARIAVLPAGIRSDADP